MATHLLVFNRENAVENILPFYDSETLESAFKKEITGRGQEAVDADLDNGYFEFKDGLTICMTSVHDERPSNRWHGTIKEIIDGFETCNDMVFTADSKEDAERRLLEQIPKERGDDVDLSTLKMGVPFDGFDSQLIPVSVRNISESDYHALKACFSGSLDDD